MGTLWKASLPCLGVFGAFVNAGEAGFEFVDAGDLVVEGGEKFFVVQVELFGDGKVACADAVAHGCEFTVEFSAGDVFGFWMFRAEELFHGNGDDTGDTGDGGPFFGGSGCLGEHKWEWSDGLMD